MLATPLTALEPVVEGARKRWRVAKALYGDDAFIRRSSLPGPVTDQDLQLRHALAQGGLEWFVHPEEVGELPRPLRPWPFSLERGRLTRNPFTTCSCLACTTCKRLDPRRAREKREWRAREHRAC